MNVLALDVGPAAIQAAVLDTSAGKVIGGGLARTDFAVATPGPDAAEVNWETLWRALAQAARAATRRAPEVEAIGMAVWTPGLVLVNHGCGILAVSVTSTSLYDLVSDYRPRAGAGNGNLAINAKINYVRISILYRAEPLLAT